MKAVFPKRTKVKNEDKERQIFINEMQTTFNLRQPKANKPTNIYLV